MDAATINQQLHFALLKPPQELSMRNIFIGIFFALSNLLTTTSVSADTRTGGAYDIEWTSSLDPAEYIDYTKSSFRVEWSDADTVSGSVSLLAASNYTAPSIYASLYTVGVVNDPPKDVQLRLSYWHFESTVEIYDEMAGKVIDSKTIDIHGGDRYGDIILYANTDSYLNTSSLRFSTTYKFTPGAYLTPSLDPSCESLSCMSVGRDKLTAYVQLAATAAVPEPSRALMLLAGACALGATARRRTAVPSARC